jgi:hypothetical protein
MENKLVSIASSFTPHILLVNTILTTSNIKNQSLKLDNLLAELSDINRKAGLIK